MNQKQNPKSPNKPEQPKGRHVAKGTKPKSKSSVASTHWDHVARWYDELVGETGSEYHRHVVLPGAIRLLALEPGDQALDIASGQGVLCRILHRGGVGVTGVDASRELINMARERSDRNITFHASDVRDLSFLSAERFDAAAIILAIQNIDPIAPVFAGVARCLKPGGRMVIVMTHPCFRGPKETSWGWDQQKKVQYRRVDRYLIPRREPIAMHPGSDPDQTTWTFHRSLQDYAKAIRNAGFMIDTIEEWSSHKVSEKGPRSAAEDLSRKEIPLFLAIRAIRKNAE